MTTPRKRKIKLLRRLRIVEASLVDAAANPHATVCLWKRADPDDHHDDHDDHDDHEEGETMHERPSYTRSDVAEAMLAHAQCLYPADTPEQSLAAALRDNDPLIHRLYKRHAELPAEVVKSGASRWSRRRARLTFSRRPTWMRRGTNSRRWRTASWSAT